ncbi:hypothetical protein BGX28_008054 [Mortierella sp. GBA30]|nr:hypothetical protein BGX28_008054 [Mortierella sp. GBA30]
MALPSSSSYYSHNYGNNQLLPVDLMIQIFMHLCQNPQDLLSCALTTRNWTQPALQELYRHPWTYLFTYQFDTESRVVDKHGSMLLLRTLFQGCMDSSKTTFPYASFARSVNLKWVHDTFDLPEVDIQTLTGFRWTRNEPPKDYLVRHLLAHRPYLSDFVHCHTPRLPRCLFAHMAATTVNPFADDAIADANAAVTLGTAMDGPEDGSAPGAAATNAVDTTIVATTDDDDWADMMQDVDHDQSMSAGFDESLLTTPPLLPVQQPIATAMPFVYATPASALTEESSMLNPHDEHGQSLHTHDTNSDSPSLSISHAEASNQTEVAATSDMIMTSQEIEQIVINETTEILTLDSLEDDIAILFELPPQEATVETTVLQDPQSLSDSTSSIAPLAEEPNETVTTYGFQQPYNPAFTQLHSRTTTSSSVGSSSRQFLATWPLTMEQTRSLVYLDLRYAVVSDTLIMSLSLNCGRIEFLKVATHLQHFPHSYSVTDHALSCLVAAQHALRLLHVENHREISQGHELVRTIDTLARMHGQTLESLVLKSHDFQNCRLAALGKACRRLMKFSAPGGMHLFREELLGLIEACKLTLEHLDFSNSDIETDCLMGIMKGLSTPAAAKGVLKALVLLGMEDTLNQETCQAIGNHGSGLDCFRLDILESEAKDVALMLSRSCARNLRVLTLGCHDVHGDLANDILEQIALNCRNVELLDVNHWQFSATAIETVIRECGMLKYLNVSYTDISEDTAHIICRCLGDVKEVPVPAGRAALDSVSTPLPVALTDSQIQTPAPVGTGDVRGPGPASVQVEQAEQVEQPLTVTEDGGDLEVGPVGALDSERIDLLRKRGVEVRAKGEDDYEEDEYMDTNMDSSPQYVTPSYSANEVKKQSQMGLVHHPPSAMDLRTIMNLDLDEALDMDLSMSMDDATGMDFDMRLDLQRYHRKFYVDEDDEEPEETEGEDIEMDDENDENDGNDENGAEEVFSREPKGKEVYVDREKDDEYYHDDVASFSTSLTSTLSCSYGSTSSASTSSSSSSTSSSSKSLEVLLHRALADTQEPVAGTLLLPPLPIPSRQDGSNGEEAKGDAYDPYAMSIQSVTEPNASETQKQLESNTPQSQPDTGRADVAPSTPLSGLHAPASLAAGSHETLTPITTSESSTVESSGRDDDGIDDWTTESRLEQVNVECCSLLSHATMSKIKALTTARQTRLVMRQGRKKSRIWVENEHDMMMTRLAVERGPELPPERLRTSIVESTENTGSSCNNVVVDESGGASAQPGSGSVDVSQSNQANQQHQQQEETADDVAASLEDESMAASAAIGVVV